MLVLYLFIPQTRSQELIELTQSCKEPWCIADPATSWSNCKDILQPLTLQYLSCPPSFFVAVAVSYLCKQDRFHLFADWSSFDLLSLGWRTLSSNLSYRCPSVETPNSCYKIRNWHWVVYRLLSYMFWNMKVINRGTYMHHKVMKVMSIFSSRNNAWRSLKYRPSKLYSPSSLNISDGILQVMRSTPSFDACMYQSCIFCIPMASWSTSSSTARAFWRQRQDSRRLPHPQK